MNSTLIKVMAGLGTFGVIAMLVALAANSSQSASAGGSSVSAVELDFDITGNSATAVGSTETCGEIAAVGGTATFDMIARGIPNPGVGGFSATLLYNPDIIRITAIDVQMIDSADNPHPGLTGGSLVSFSEAVPSEDGAFQIDEAVFGGSESKPTGDGVLLRITVEAKAAGQTIIELGDEVELDGTPNVLDYQGTAFTVDSVGDGRIVVGDTCANVPTPTPSPTPVPANNTMGDTDCDGQVTTRDNQALLRFVLGQNPLSQTEPCPDAGAAVDGTGNLNIWGDWDCDGQVTTRDNQALLRFVLGQNSLSQTEPCPDIGTSTTV